MVPLQVILTAVLRQAGKVLNTVFGWATTLLFGKVPEKRQLYLSIIGLGSVLWIVVVLGIAFPRLGAFLLAFIPLPEWVDDRWVRLAMLGLAVLLPPAVGVVSLFLVEPERRPHGKDRVRAILKGYPCTLGLALTLVTMIVVAPILKVMDLVRGWTSSHVPVVVKASDYFEVINDIEQVLRGQGHEPVRDRATFLLRWPTRLFTLFAGSGVDDLVAENLTVLKLPRFEVMLHPSDLVIRGKEKDVVRVQAMLAELLTFTRAYLTWSREAHDVEDRLVALWRQTTEHPDDFNRDEALEKLEGIERDLRKLDVSFEEWEVLFREKLVVERAVLRGLYKPESQRQQPQPVGRKRVGAGRR